MTIPPTADITINTTSEAMASFQPTGTAPTITMNGEPFAQLPHPGVPSGFQVVVMNSSGDLTNPANIVLNEIIIVQDEGGSWSSSYEWMYAQMIHAVLNAGNIDLQLLVVASFGLDLNMPPSNDGLEFLLERGAGAGLQQWDSTPDAGSQAGGWIAEPASYILIGGSGYGYGNGFETFVYNQNNPAPATLSVTLTNNVPPTPTHAAKA